MTTPAEEIRKQVSAELDKVNPYIFFCANHGMTWPEDVNLLDNIMALLVAQQQSLLEKVEDSLLNNSVALKNEETAILWPDVVQTIANIKGELGEGAA